jgi:outer membrane protein assembly factor BamB
MVTSGIPIGRAIQRTGRSSCLLLTVLGYVVPAHGATNSSVQAEWTFRARSRIYSTPAIRDLSARHAGDEILVVSSAEHKLICLDASGQSVWTYDGFATRLTSQPTAADLDGDRQPEILIGSRREGLVCLEHDGVLRWQKPVPGGIAWSKVQVADTDGDGEMEVYSLSRAGRLECRDPQGVNRWSYQVPGASDARKTDASPTVGDLDGDGRAEIAVCGPGGVWCLDSRGRERWHTSNISEPSSLPVFADVFDDPRCEVLVATKEGVLYVTSGQTGSILWNHRTFNIRVDSSVAVGDVDGDGRREVLYGDGKGMFYCLGENGEERWCFKTGGWIESAPVLRDVDGDGKTEILFGSADGNLYCLASSGKLEWSFSTGRRISASPAIYGPDQQGAMRILLASHNGCVYSLACPRKPSR